MNNNQVNTNIPSVAGAADMELTPNGRRAGADSGDPQVSSALIFKDETTQVGVWECTPGGWAIFDRDNMETVLVVAGQGVITDADGTEQLLSPGVVTVLPKGWSGRWDITETLRKVYIIVR